MSTLPDYAGVSQLRIKTPGLFYKLLNLLYTKERAALVLREMAQGKTISNLLLGSVAG